MINNNIAFAVPDLDSIVKHCSFSHSPDRIRLRLFLVGRTANKETKRRLHKFRTKLEELTKGKSDFTFEMDDPYGNSYMLVGCVIS